MSSLEFIIAIVIVVSVLTAIVNRFKETRVDALKQGHGPVASTARGLAYVAMAIGGIVFFGFLLLNIETIGLVWTLLLIFLFFGVGWSLLGQWIFDKKPSSGKKDKDDK
jgi:predicted membrane protein